MSLVMTKAERETFLAEPRIGVLSVRDDGRGPLAIPVWYSYEPGSVIRIATGRGSKKAGLLAKAGRASLCVQTETPPYKYLSIEGPVIIGPLDFERDIRRMAYRYLGQQGGDWYLQTMAGELVNSVLVTLTPQRWLSADYAKMAVAGA